MKAAHYLAGGVVYRATLRGDLVTLESRSAGQGYICQGVRKAAGGHIQGMRTTDERVADMIRAFERLLDLR